MKERCLAVAPQVDPVEDVLGFLDNLSDDEFSEKIDSLYDFDGGKTPPGTFSDALTRFIDNADISIEELAFQSKVSTRTIGKMKNNENYQPTLKRVIKICIGLRLNPSYSYELIDLAGYTLKRTKQDTMYRFLIDKMYNASISDCNKILKRAGVKPL